MKTLMTLLIFCISLNLSAVELDVNWSDFFQKEVTVICENNHEFCQEICGDRFYCKIKESSCRNCLGTSLQMTHIFNEMGRRYISRDEVSDYELIDLLKSGEFVALSSKSVYNHVTKFNHPKIKRKFRSLCGDISDLYPIVFFEVDAIRRVSEVKFVTCQNRGKIHVLEMFRDENIILNDEESPELH